MSKIRVGTAVIRYGHSECYKGLVLARTTNGALVVMWEHGIDIEDYEPGLTPIVTDVARLKRWLGCCERARLRLAQEHEVDLRNWTRMENLS